ncbi:hypothetical protein NDU88_003468 [Pleurodeles waltl]|uniref:Uncharacterized protein n=1 Tax=Pleurodeles waltl TaxID=8319 RepID=A0AAV7QA55_PLEWA|nr:hypothetical protein NDU88_003468 [Pleurodeles waltl]
MEGTYQETKRELRGTRLDLWGGVEVRGVEQWQHQTKSDREKKTEAEKTGRGKLREMPENLLWGRKEREVTQVLSACPAVQGSRLVLRYRRGAATGKSRGLGKTTYGSGGWDFGAPKSAIYQGEVYGGCTPRGEAMDHGKEFTRVWSIGAYYHRVL